MIQFLKNLLKRVNFKSDNEEINNYNKIIYSIIIICAIIFMVFIAYFIIKQLPDFIQNIKNSWNDSKSILNRL